jgi:hypothetical protein
MVQSLTSVAASHAPWHARDAADLLAALGVEPGLTP